MFLILFIVLLVAWLLGFLAFHVAGGLIHLLLIVAVICLIVHFVRGRSARKTQLCATDPRQSPTDRHRPGLRRNVFTSGFFRRSAPSGVRLEV